MSKIKGILFAASTRAGIAGFRYTDTLTGIHIEGKLNCFSNIRHIIYHWANGDCAAAGIYYYEKELTGKQFFQSFEDAPVLSTDPAELTKYIKEKLEQEKAKL
jgi:hypothetical protein